jgi:tripartite-type tricarboxylate transporter receptor subunit TctC
LSCVVSSFAFAVGASSLAHAEDWPTRPIELIVPTGPGHAVDFMARAITAGVSKELGQTMFVDNMPGAAGAVGAHAAARAAPDGHTFLFAFASLLSSNIYLYKSLPYDPRHDFTAVAMVCDKGPMVVSVNPQLGSQVCRTCRRSPKLFRDSASMVGSRLWHLQAPRSQS